MKLFLRKSWLSFLSTLGLLDRCQKIKNGIVIDKVKKYVIVGDWRQTLKKGLTTFFVLDYVFIIFAN